MAGEQAEDCTCLFIVKEVDIAGSLHFPLWLLRLWLSRIALHNLLDGIRRMSF